MPRPDDARGWLSALRPWRTCVRMVLLAFAAAASVSASSSRLPLSPHAGLGQSPPRVVGIYPSAERLPANLLRMYIVFSAPMAVGESHSRLRLVDDAGRTVDRAFLALDEELWDPSGRRLTVLFDPGRIKRGLRANLEMAPPLREGHRYRLIVDAGWPDAQGRRLGEPHVKTFEALVACRTRPDPGTWSIQPPEAHTRTPLVLQFDAPLDRALLFTSVAVADERGESVHGTIEVSEGEREWSFTPARPWAPGGYRVHVAPELEDPAGNNLERVFDAELSSGGSAPPTAAVRTREFIVGPGRPSPS